MNDQDKTKVQLLKEIHELQQENCFLRTSLQQNISKQTHKTYYDMIVEKASDGFWLLDKEFNTVFVNPALEKMLGYTMEEMLGRNWYDFGDTECVELAKELEKRREIGIIEAHEFVFIHKVGRKIMTRIATTPLYDKDGNFDGAIGVLSDISSHKKALQTSEERYKMILNAAMFPIVISTFKGKVVFINQAAVEFFGVSFDEIDQLSSVDFWANPIKRNEFVSQLKENGIVNSIELEYKTKKNGIRHTIMSSTIINYNEDKAILSILNDVTERKKAEQALRLSEEKFSKAFNISPDAITLTDIETSEIIDANAGFERVYGYAVKDVIGKTALELDIWADLSSRSELIKILNRDGIVLDFEARGRRKSGELSHGLVSGSIITVGERKMLLITARDITEHKKAEEVLRESEARLNAILSSMNDIIFEIDLNNCFQGYFAPNNKSLYVQPEFFIGKRFDEILPENVSSLLRQAIDSINSGNPYQQFEYHLTVDNIIEWEHAVITPRYSKSNELVGVTVVCRNITERKKVEESLEESQRKLATLMGNLPGLAFRSMNDKDWTMLFMSEGCFELTGFYPQELEGNKINSYGNLIHPDDADMVWHKVQDAINSKTFWKIEYRIHTKEGKEKWVWEQGCGLYSNTGELEVLEGFITEITERKKSEQALKESEELHRTILKTAMDGFWITDSKLNFLKVNDTYCRMSGYTRDELLKMSVSDVEAIESPEESQVHAKIIFEHGEDRFQSQHRRKDGTIYDVEISIQFRNIEGGRFTVFIRDITQNKLAEEALQKSEEKYRYIVDNAPIGIFQRSIQGSFNFCNLTLAKQFECNSVDEFLLNYNDIKTRWAEPAQFIEFNELLLKQGEVLGFENKLKLKSGRTKWFSLYYKLDSTKSILDGFSLDITELKHAERALNMLATSFAGLSGKAFFEAISKHIATEMGIDYVYVGELTDTKEAVRVLGGFALGEAMGEMLYNLSDTPCSDVIKNDTCLFPTGIQQQYPKDYLLQQMGIDSYLGSRIYNKEQEPIGLLVALHSKPINNPGILSDLFSIFLDRIAAELHRMHAYEALHKNEAIQRKMISNIGDVIVIIDKNGIIQYKSLNIEKWFGWKPEELVGESTWDNVHPDDLNMGQVFLDSIMSEPNASGTIELRYRKKDNSYCWIEISIVNLLHDPDICGLLGNYHDITERKQAEDKLRDSQVLYHDLVETSQDIIWQCDAQGRYIYLNLAYEKIFGYQLDEMLGRSFTDFQSPQQAKHNLEHFGRLLQANGIVNGYESVGLKKDGTELLLVSNAKVIFDAEGRMSGTRGTTFDITERKKNDAILIKLYAAINSSKASIVITDIDGNIEFANPYFAELTSYSEVEYLGKNPRVLKSGIHSDDYYKALWDTIKSGNTWEGEFCNRKKNGELYWEKSIITPIKNDKEEIVNFVAVKSDITNEKKHDHLVDITLKIYELSEYLTIEKILKYSIELGIQLTNSEIGFFHFVNEDQETLSLQAWSAKTMDICNIPKFDKHYPISKAGVWVDCFYQKKPVFHNDYSSLSHKKGLPEGHATLIRDLSIPVIVENKVVAIFGVGNKESDYTKTDAEFLSIFAESIWNIIRRKQAEIDTINAKEKAEEGDRLKSAFLANMSHEIRTPMNGILGFSTLLSQPGLESEEQQKFIKLIQKSGARMLNIITEIVDISKIESGLVEISIKEVNVNKQLELVFKHLNPDAQAKSLTMLIKDRLPMNRAIFMTDEEKFNKILLNLIKNAIKYTDKGSIEFGFHLTSSSTKLNELQFYVKDTGIGISKSRQKAIFERFVQADIADVQARQGAGLGLSIAKAYIEMLGGKIWVDSEIGKGSVFYFTLPYNTKGSL